MIAGSISGTVWFLIFLVFKIGIFHSYRVASKSGMIIKLFLSAIAGCFFSSLISGRSMVEILIGIIVTVSLFILYMPFYYTISSSISIQTLVLLSKKDDLTYPISGLKNTFASREIIDYKLTSMENSGLLISNGRAYKVSTKGKFIALLFGLIKRLWKLGSGG